MAETLIDTQAGTPFYLLAKGETKSNVDFETHFNPKLEAHSVYFRNLQKMLECAKQHAGSTEAVCKKEFKELRLSAFRDELLYHNVNKRFFMNELAFKQNESAY